MVYSKKENEVNLSRIGEILLGENNHPKDGNHYIIYFKDIDGFDFEGAMITSKLFGGKNIPMEVSHFEKMNAETNNEWKIVCNNSHLVLAKLHKFGNMGPFLPVGKLTDEGVRFLEKTISQLSLESWEEYLNRTK